MTTAQSAGCLPRGLSFIASVHLPNTNLFDFLDIKLSLSIKKNNSAFAKPRQTSLGYPEIVENKHSSVGISHPLKHVLFSVLYILWCEEHSSHRLAHSQKEQTHLFSLEASRLNPTHGQVITKQSWDTSTHRDTAGSLLQGEEIVPPVGTQTTTQFAQ